MIVKVKLFAAARGSQGCDALTVELPQGANVQQLRKSIAANHPKLTTLLPSSMIAVDHEYADDEFVLKAGAEVALIPPVSGG